MKGKGVEGGGVEGLGVEGGWLKGEGEGYERWVDGGGGSCKPKKHDNFRRTNGPSQRLE